MFGDFHEIVSEDDKDGGGDMAELCMTSFRDAIDDCGVCNLRPRGPKFTCQRGKCAKTLIMERVDIFWCWMNGPIYTLFLMLSISQF